MTEEKTTAGVETVNTKENGGFNGNSAVEEVNVSESDTYDLEIPIPTYGEICEDLANFVKVVPPKGRWRKEGHGSGRNK